MFLYVHLDNSIQQNILSVYLLVNQMKNGMVVNVFAKMDSRKIFIIYVFKIVGMVSKETQLEYAFVSLDLKYIEDIVNQLLVLLARFMIQISINVLLDVDKVIKFGLIINVFVFQDISLISMVNAKPPVLKIIIDNLEYVNVSLDIINLMEDVFQKFALIIKFGILLSENVFKDAL